MSNARRLRRSTWAIGLPNRPPSPQARMLAASPHMASLPPGAWHTSDYAAAALARTQPVVGDAVHAGTGAKFRLPRLQDGTILSLSPEGERANELIAANWDDPSGWANTQDWWIEPPTGEAPASGHRAIADAL